MRIAISHAKLAFTFLAITLFSVIQANGQASAIPTNRLLNPEDLVKLLQTSGTDKDKDKPLMLQVGSHVLFAQAHIPGSEYIGPASTENGLVNSASVWTLYRVPSSLFSIAVAAPGAIVPT